MAPAVMTEPAETVRVPWADQPPSWAVRVDDMLYRHNEAYVDWVWWRGRWCAVASELPRIMGVDTTHALIGLLDRRAAAGELGILFERVEAP